MTASEKTQEIMKAIFNVQQSVPPIEKTAKGSTGNRTYGYTPLDGIWEKISAAMKANDLVVTASPTTAENGVGEYFSTTIYHIPSGEYIQSLMQMRTVKDDPQGIGSAITYYRRYMLVSMLGLHIKGSDTDATEHKLATAQQKARLIGAVKEIFPDLNNQADIIQTIQNIIGKHPSYLRQDEAEDAVKLVKAFTAKQLNDD